MRDSGLTVTPANAQRRAEYAMDDAWIRAFLDRAPVGHIATRWDEQPFITPTNFWYDPDRHELYFHSNIVGRVRANSQRHEQVCFEASEFGRLLASNVALEFTIQYESVVAFGNIRVIEDDAEKRRVLYGLIRKYFPTMEAGQHYRSITDQELKRTSVYAISVQSWSGKRNWPDRAAQSGEWKPLGAEWFE
jgi:nitroimidazol reductase NimA-like FMN-containing flavoprotein (pyridoxamine 5'-phosphate oxidase superfamily)